MKKIIIVSIVLATVFLSLFSMTACNNNKHYGIDEIYGEYSVVKNSPTFSTKLYPTAANNDSLSQVYKRWILGVKTDNDIVGISFDIEVANVEDVENFALSFYATTKDGKIEDGTVLKLYSEIEDFSKNIAVEFDKTVNFSHKDGIKDIVIVFENNGVDNNIVRFTLDNLKLLTK